MPSDDTTARIADETPRRTDLVRDLPAAGDLSAPANGQTLYVLDESTGGVVAVDPFEPTKRWTAVSAATEVLRVAPGALLSSVR